jgi:hypothetical protein
MPLPLIPLGYAAAALLTVYGGKKVYDQVGEAKAAVQDVKEAAGATAAAAQDAADVAVNVRDGAAQTVNKLVGSAADFTHRLHDGAHKFKAALLTAGTAVLDAWAAVSAFYVGLMAGFGIHFLRLIDKGSLFQELVFYATIISALRAPAALVTALAADGTRAKAIEWTAPVVVATAILVPFVLLDTFFALLFCIAGAVLLFLTWLRPQAFGRAFYAVCALIFGYLYAETLSLQKPDTKVILTDSKPVRITLLMSTPHGLIGLDENRQMAQYAWSSIASVSVEQGATKHDGLRELLKMGRTAFEGTALRAFK